MKTETIKITPNQARALIWAINSFEAAYEFTEYDDADFRKSMKSLQTIYGKAAAFAEANGK